MSTLFLGQTGSEYPMTDSDRNARNILIGGIVSIAIAIGISRFMYTPILPAMQQALNFDDGFAGYLASANYAGYLLGSIWAAMTSNGADREGRVRRHLMLTILCTAGMGMVSSPAYWYFFRFLAGFTSAIVFIFASGFVLEKLAQFNRHAWFGWPYAGVGLGIALSAISIPVLVTYAGWRAGWIVMAGVGFLLFFIAWALPVEAQERDDSGGQINPENGAGAAILPWLAISYGLVGFGYIVTGTFLVSLVERAFDSIAAGGFVWLLVGLAAIPSCAAWSAAGHKFGFINALIAAQVVQAVGIILPIVSPGYFGAMMGAIFYGGTFIGIAAVTVIIGRQIDPRNADRNIAILTAAFGLGQMVGPSIAGKIAVYTDGLAIPIYFAACTVVLATSALLAGVFFGKRKRSMQDDNPSAKERDHAVCKH